MKNEGKIKLWIVIVLITLLLIIGIIAFVVINKDVKTSTKGGNILTEVGKENEEKEEEVEVNEEILNSDFAVQFLKLENNKKNMVYSPLSIKYALNMLNEGADGNTKIQIENIIGQQNLTKYDNIKKILSLANGVFIRDTFNKKVKEDYKEILNTKYNAEIKYDSFKNAKNINEWIEDKTLGIIENMLQDESVQNPYNVMLLINALAIDMEWKEQFEPKDTISSEFYLEDGSTIDATTMNMKTFSDSISYYKDKNITSMTMDLKQYKDTQLEFMAIMPKENLSDYIETFSVNEIDNIIKESKKASKTRAGVNISIPRFSVAYDLKLKEDLQKLGMIDAFDDKLANFSKMSDELLYVGDALHKANIDFTEKGVKAAAVTTIYITCGMALEENKPVEINIDKPFLYLIRDKNTGEIWFLGTVYEPNLWEDDKDDYQYR